jgi:hypothetical protein
MSKTIQVKRGTLANLPTLQEGELGFTTDTHAFYIGDSTGNIQITPTTVAVNATCTEINSAVALLNQIRVALITNGICS